MTAEKIVEIEQATVRQAENPLWHALRKGRITASSFYKVKTKVESLTKAGTNAVSAKKLVASLIGEYTPGKWKQLIRPSTPRSSKKIIKMLSIVNVDYLFMRPNSFKGHHLIY